MAKESGLLARLIKLENQRAEGWLKRDKSILTSLMDENFVEINYFGRLTKTDILEELFPNLTLEKFDMQDFKLLESDGDLAILSYRADEELTYKGNKVSGTFHITAVYRYKSYKWSPLIWQITPFMEDSKD